MTEPLSSDPDGYVIIHHPADGSEAYCVGPFPPILQLAELMRDASACTCRRVVMACAFPPGVRMGIGLPDGLDLDDDKPEPIH